MTIMPARKTITREDIIPLEQYARERKQRRADLVAMKRHRRVHVGPWATAYFESYDTMWHQIHEMLYIEKGGEAQIEDELRAYNPLIPQGRDLSCTFMFEIDDPVRRNRILYQLAHVEETIYLELGGERIMADPEHDVDRTTEDGKTSSIHFLHFRFTDEQARTFRELSTRVILGVAHENYRHMAELSPEVKAALAEDLD
jgi:hypothetical protein